MGPRDERRTPQDDLFRNELVNLIDPRHPLVKLAERIDWSVFEREWSELFASPTGRPAAPPWLIAGLLYLQVTDHSRALYSAGAWGRSLPSHTRRLERDHGQVPRAHCRAVARTH